MVVVLYAIRRCHVQSAAEVHFRSGIRLVGRVDWQDSKILFLRSLTGEFQWESFLAKSN